MAGFAGFQRWLRKGGEARAASFRRPQILAGGRGEGGFVLARSRRRMREGIRECGLDVRGKTVLLKPNFVEFDPNTCINTDVAVVAAALEVFRSLGAAEVRIGEGPGHRRDTYAMAELARYRRKFPSSIRRVRGSESRRRQPAFRISRTVPKSISPTASWAPI